MGIKFDRQFLFALSVRCVRIGADHTDKQYSATAHQMFRSCVIDYGAFIRGRETPPLVLGPAVTPLISHLLSSYDWAFETPFALLHNSTPLPP